MRQGEAVRQMQKKDDQSGWAPLWREALRAASLGWDLAVPIFGGVLLGHILDRRLETDYIFTLGLLLLGVATGFYSVFRTVQRLEARERMRAEREEKQEIEQ
jgi:F0F1-type ATP synthase assembly protein I